MLRLTRQSGRAEPKRRARRLGLLIVLLSIFGYTWALEIPQRFAVGFAAKSLLGISADCSHVGLFTAIKAGQVRLYADDAMRAQLRPFLEIQGLNARYTLFPRDGRYVRSVHIDTLLVHPDVLPTKTPSSSAPMPMPPTLALAPLLARLPFECTINAIEVSGEQAGYQYQLGGLSLRAVQTANAGLDAVLSSGALGGTVASSDNTIDTSFTNGTVDVRLALHADGSAECSTVAQVPQTLALDLVASLRRDTEKQWTVEAAATNAHVDDPIITSFLLSLGLPSGFSAFAARLDASDSKASIHLVDGAWGDVDLAAHGQIDALRVVRGDQDLFNSDVSLAATAQANALDIVCTVGKAKPLRLRMLRAADRRDVQFKIPDWRSRDLLPVVPPSLRSWLEARPVFDGLDLTGLFTWQNTGYSFSADVIPRLVRNNQPIPCLLHIKGSGALSGDAPLAEVTLAGQLTDAPVNGTATMGRDYTVSGEASFKKIDAALLCALAGAGDVPALQGVYLGTSVKATYDQTGLRAACSAQTDVARLLGARQPVPVTLSGPITADTSFQQFRADALQLASPGLLQTELRDATLAISPLAATGSLGGTLDLAGLASLAGITSVYGQATLRAPLRFEQNQLTGTMDIEASEVALPGLPGDARPPIHIEAALAYDPSAGSGRIEGMKGLLGQGVQLDSRQIAFMSSPFHAEGPIALDANLSDLVSLGLFQAAQGQLNATGAMRIDSEGLAVTEGNATLQAENLVLPENWAAVTGLNMQLTAQYKRELSGKGQLAIAEARVAGATLRDAQSPIVLEGQMVRLDPLEAELFGGRVAAVVIAGLLAPGSPLSVSATVADLDLDAFTQEFKPPQVALTGMVNGTAAAAYDRIGGITHAATTLSSTEGFTINRDFLARVLLSQYLEGVTGGKRIESLTKDVLGDATQRPFDAAELELHSKGDDLAGQATLRSKALNLTIDLRIDPAALEEALKLHQETQLQDIQGIHTAAPETSSGQE